MRTKLSNSKNASLLGPNYLDEDFVLEDYKEGSLRDVLEEISDSTKFKIVEPARFKIYSIIHTKDKGSLRIVALDPDFMTADILLSPDASSEYFKQGNMGNLPIHSLKLRGMTNEQIEEVKRIGFLLRYRDDKSEFTLIPSDAFLATLCRQLGIGRLSDGIDPLRDIYLASKMRYADEFGIVYRTYKGYGKVFGCFSPKFSATPQTVCYEFMEGLKDLGDVAFNISIRRWKITHFLTTVQFSLNSLTEVIGGVKITPGVRLKLSDVGDASFTLESILCLNGGTVLLGDKVTRRHTGKIIPSDIISEYSKCISHISDALGYLRDGEGMVVEDKFKEMKKLLKRIGFESAFGLRNTNAFLKEYLSEETVQCTYFDVLIDILKIPGIIQGKYQPNIEELVSLSVGGVLGD